MYMRDRSSKTASYSVDVIPVTAMGNELAVLFARNSTERERWSLPWKIPQTGEMLDAAAARVADDALGESPHETATPRTGYAWFPMRDLPPLSPRQRAMIESARRTIEGRLDQAPIAFRLLPATFTLSELQQIYELLLGKRLHKASFRRALQAAWLVEPTEEWRSEGRGRPAQLFRYAPKKRRRPQRGVRFDFLYP